MKLTFFPVVVFAAITAFPAVSVAADPPRIFIVVDASASMATSWPGQGGGRIGAVRATVDAMAAALGGRKVMPEIAIRVYGDQHRPDSAESCTDSRLLRPLAPAGQHTLERSLDPVQPLGAASLAQVLKEVAADIGSPQPGDTVLIILDGLDWCGGDLQKGFSDLTLDGEGAEVHVFGFGVDVADQAEISQHVSFHSVGWPAQLLQAMSVIVSKQLSLPLQNESTGLTLVGVESLGFTPVTMEIVGSWAKEPISVDLSRENPRFDAALGTASISVSGANPDQVQRLVRVPVVPEQPLEVEFFAAIPVELAARITASGWGGAPELRATWSGAQDEAYQLVLSESGVPGASWFHSQDVAGASGQVSMPLPAGPMEMSLQLRKDIGQASAVISEKVFFSPGRRVILVAENEVEAGSTLGVTWDAESYEEDLINLVTVDAPPEWLGTTYDAIDGSPCDFPIPFDQCVYEIRYIDGRTFEILARTPVEVGGRRAGLAGPPIVSELETFSVRWWGQAGSLDVLTLNAPDSDVSEYINWASPADGSPAEFQAPQAPGNYEIRYVVAGKDVAATLPIVVKGIEVTLDVPDTVMVGERLQVAWTGPNGPDDFLVIVRRGQKLKRKLDFAYVSAGSPLTMAAPDRPGAYEVQYISGRPRAVLATAEFSVTK